MSDMAIYFIESKYKEIFKLKQMLEKEKIPFDFTCESYPDSNFIHYHLSGSDWEYRKYSPNNLLLYEVACWANKKGIKKMHLGGGMSANDSLFGFKKQFNKNGRVKFYIGRTIFDSEKYKYLMEIRSKSDDKFDMNNNYMIQYRG